MSTTSTIIYQGNLRTVATHTRSGEQISTDAPVDNQGKGEFFSPTDLLATSLGACMVTIMGISAQKRIIEAASRECPVAQSLHPDLKQTIRFHYAEN